MTRPLAVIGLTAALALAGCGAATDTPGTAQSAVGSSTATAGTSAADHSAADVMFSAMMIPHHQQAVEMADLVPTRTTNADVLALAAGIKAAQQPEIDQMQGYLDGWGEEANDAAAHAGHAGMEGMMSDDDLTALAGLKDAAFDKEWLTMMIAHHEGAVTMAQDVQKNGSHAATATLAAAIIEVQRREIDQMKAMLAG